MVERGVILSNDGIFPNPLPIEEERPLTKAAASTGTFTASQRALILEALQGTGWVIGGPRGAAARLGLKRTTLITKMRKFGILRPNYHDTLDQFMDQNQSEDGWRTAVE